MSDFDPDDPGPDTPDAQAYARDFTGNRGSYPSTDGGYYSEDETPNVIMQGWATRKPC